MQEKGILTHAFSSFWKNENFQPFNFVTYIWMLKEKMKLYILYHGQIGFIEGNSFKKKMSQKDVCLISLLLICSEKFWKTARNLDNMLKVKCQILCYSSFCPQCCDGKCPPCEQMCNKTLGCKKHKCNSRCHTGMSIKYFVQMTCLLLTNKYRIMQQCVNLVTISFELVFYNHIVQEAEPIMQWSNTQPTSLEPVCKVKVTVT